MSAYRRGRASGRRSFGSRWMDLRYAGTCKVCGRSVPAGALAFWDAGARTVTCGAIDCADADGLTTNKPLTGPWDHRTDTRVLADGRVGSAAPVVDVYRFSSGATMTRNRLGRCEDAPCCGCCD
jgi:hypothetical protein